MAERRRAKRVVLKMSGEALASPESGEPIDAAIVERIAREIVDARAELDLELAVMIGGGNTWRGSTGAGAGMDRATSDTMGMLGTVINALALQDALERQCQPTRVLTAIHMAEVAEPYIRLGRSGTSRRVMWSCSRPGWGTPTSPRTPQRRFVRQRSRRTCCTRGPTGVWTACTARIPGSTPLPRGSRKFPSWTSSRRT